MPNLGSLSVMKTTLTPYANRISAIVIEPQKESLGSVIKTRYPQARSLQYFLTEEI